MIDRSIDFIYWILDRSSHVHSQVKNIKEELSDDLSQATRAISRFHQDSSKKYVEKHFSIKKKLIYSKYFLEKKGLNYSSFILKIKSCSASPCSSIDTFFHHSHPEFH